MAKSKLMNVLIISVFCNLLALSLVAYTVHAKGGIVYLKSKILEVVQQDEDKKFNAYYLNRVSVFRELENFRDDIYFIGDSITDIGEWQELLSNSDVKNRGINGDTTTGVLNRLDEILEGNPRKVFLMCGINNLQSKISFSQTVNEYKAILSELQNITPPAEIYLLSIIPITKALYREYVLPKHPSIHMPETEEIDRLNNAIKKLADRYRNVSYIDLAPLRDEDGELIADYTIDGLHLNGKGLTAWAEIVEPLLYG